MESKQLDAVYVGGGDCLAWLLYNVQYDEPI